MLCNFKVNLNGESDDFWRMQKVRILTACAFSSYLWQFLCTFVRSWSVCPSACADLAVDFCVCLCLWICLCVVCLSVTLSFDLSAWCLGLSGDLSLGFSVWRLVKHRRSGRHQRTHRSPQRPCMRERVLRLQRIAAKDCSYSMDMNGSWLRLGNESGRTRGTSRHAYLSI